MTESIRAVTPDEHGRIAAKHAVETMTVAPNPYEAGSVDFILWRASYCKWVLAYSAGIGSEVSA